MFAAKGIRKIALLLTVIVIAGLGATNSAWAYKLTTDDVNGGNPKLAKRAYQVFIQANPNNPTWRDEVVAALNKWRAELGSRGIDLQLQVGNPPQNPVDLNAYNAEVARFNNDPNPNPANYPEMAKYQAKQNTLSVYWDSTENIRKRGTSDISGGLASSYWGLGQNGKADTVELSDIFIPNDPKGGTAEIKATQIHNVSMHEFAHPAGFDHYTKSQIGEVMQTDSSLFTDRINIKDEDRKGLDAIYGAAPNIRVQPNATQRQSSLLPDNVRSMILMGIDSVWEYSYQLSWNGGAEASYFQVETGGATVYVALGIGLLSDWIAESPTADETFLTFYADKNYLGDHYTDGMLDIYSPDAPGQRRLITAGTFDFGSAPIPEPTTLSLVLGMLSALGYRRRMKRQMTKSRD